MAKLDAFLATDLRVAKRPQRKLSEPEGRVFASAVERAFERSENRLFAGRILLKCLLEMAR
jgi:hypothetical protein